MQVNVDNTDSSNNSRLGVDGISWEKSLQNQIHVEQQMLEGTAKFVNVCKNEQQVGVFTSKMILRPSSH